MDYEDPTQDNSSEPPWWLDLESPTPAPDPASDGSDPWDSALAALPSPEEGVTQQPPPWPTTRSPRQRPARGQQAQPEDLWSGYDTLPEMGSPAGMVPLGLPHATECERAILGGLLIDPALLPTVSARLEPEDLYHDRHKLIYGAILALGEKADLRTVQAHLESFGLLSQAGGLSYLTGLDLDLPDISRLEAYLDVVKERALRRAICRAGGDLLRGALDATQSVPDLAAGALARFQALVKGSSRGRGFRLLADVLEDWLDELDANYGVLPEEGVMTGIPSLDAITGGMERGHMWLIGGRPGVGKTSILLQCLENEAIGEGRHAAFFSLEMGEREVLFRLAAQQLGIGSTRIRHRRLSQGELAQIHALRGQLRMAGNIHVDEQSRIDASTIAARTMELKSRVPLAAVFVDYLTLVKGEGGGRVMAYERTEQIAKDLASLAKEADVKMIVAAQLSRNKDSKKPRLWDLRDAGEQPATGVILLHREERLDGDGEVEWLDPEGEAIVAKNRYGETGRAKIRFVGATQRFVPGL